MIEAAAIPLSLYVHVPWCVRKCPYCDFNSHQRPAHLPEDDYVAALLADLDLELGFVQGRSLQSIFFGGGTPSLFSGRAIQAILDGVRRRIALVDNCEITLETNPGTAEFDRFEAYWAAGVNRLSFGVQSFNDEHLRRLGRIHGGDEARNAFRLARAAGFDNINIDLMYGLPGQTVTAAVADLQAALVLAPEHLSHYQLTLEPQTVFARNPPADLPDDDQRVDMLDACQTPLREAGFVQYEVSAYARTGRESRHNLNYWLYGDYLAVGAGGHAKYTTADGVFRRARQRTPSLYLRTAGTAAALVDDRAVEASELAFEFMLNALRLRSGFPIELYAARTGRELLAEAGYRDAVSRGLLEVVGAKVRASELGYRFLNDTLECFLTESS